MGNLSLVVFLVIFVSWGPCVHGQVIINELLPDPAGPDSGKEFVELINMGSAGANLRGMELHFANGAEEANWVVRWSCGQDIFLDSGEYFLIGDRNWQWPELTDVEVYLGLQNGPDAIRLVQGADVLDMVGYGSLTDEDLMEGSSVAVVPGLSLARRPDGFDTNNNSSDFVAAEASPGRLNFLPYHFRILAFTVDPPSAVNTNEIITFEITLENIGTETLPTAEVALHIGSEQITSLLDGNSPGHRRSLLLRGISGTQGKLSVGLSIQLPVSPGVLDIPLGFYQVGPGSLVINEIMGSPDQGQGEWVEFLINGRDELNLNQYKIRDEGGRWQALPEIIGSNGELVVVAQDSLALCMWLDNIQAQGGVSGCEKLNQGRSQLLAMGQWPSLNNTAPEGRDFADRLYLCDWDGCIVDHVTFGWENSGLVQELPAGHSLERVGFSGGTKESSLWAPALAQSGSTPGCPNSVDLSGAKGPGLQLNPLVLDPGRGDVAINISFSIEAPGVGWDVRLYDLWGQLVRDMGSEMHGPGHRQLIWDGKNDSGQWLSTGAYIVLLRVRSPTGGILAREKKLAVLRRPE